MTQPADEPIIEALRRQREALLAELPATASGLDWCARHTDAVDEALARLFRDVMNAYLGVPPIALVATGGYGRRELSPHSDVDLAVVPLEETAGDLDAAIRMLYGRTHDIFGAVGLDVGWSYRLIADAAGLDEDMRSSLLDSRLVAGSRRAFDALIDAVWETFPEGEFLIAKLEEREAAMRKYGETPLLVEPHLKEGAGGLRCFQCANWMGMAVGERAARPGRAYERVLDARNALHAVAGRRVDHLTRGRQAAIAEARGLDPDDWMSGLAGAMLELHDTYLQACDKLHEARYELADGVLAIRGEARLVGAPSLSGAAMGVAVATRLGLRVAPVGALPRGILDSGDVMRALAMGEATIRNLDSSGLLAALLPELARCKTLMPSDAQHAYSVMEHTFRVVRFLESLRGAAGFLGQLFDEVQDAGTLYLAALLHDVGKASPDRDHSEAGAEVAAHVARRWRLQERTADLVRWLVEEHLTMARFIRMRDVSRPETAIEFASLVGDRERLVHLTLLTWADVSAVAPHSMTPAQETFLRDLFEATQAALQSEQTAAPDPEVYRTRLVRRLRPADADEDAIRSFVQGLPAHYLLSTPPDLVRDHYAYAMRALIDEPTIESAARPELGATDFTVCCPDAPGLLSRLLGVFYAFDLSMVGFRASTAKLEKPIALDVFTLTFGGRPLPPATCDAVAAKLQQMLRGEATMEQILRARGKDPDRAQEILKWTYQAGAPGILEVRAPRGRGMAYRLCRLIAQQGWYVVGARLGQWAGQGAAAFYLLDGAGQELPAGAVGAVLGPRPH